MAIYIVEYMNQDRIGNQCLEMHIEAPNPETVYEICDENYPELDIIGFYLAADQYD